MTCEHYSFNDVACQVCVLLSSDWNRWCLRRVWL